MTTIRNFGRLDVIHYDTALYKLFGWERGTDKRGVSDSYVTENLHDDTPPELIRQMLPYYHKKSRE